jgi:hypothetical protein
VKPNDAAFSRIFRSSLTTVGSTFVNSSTYHNDSPVYLEKFANWVRTQEQILFSVERLAGNGFSQWKPSPCPSWVGFEGRPAATVGHVECLVHSVNEAGTISYWTQHAPELQEIGAFLAHKLAERTYRFSAERFTLGSVRRALQRY